MYWWVIKMNQSGSSLRYFKLLQQQQTAVMIYEVIVSIIN